MEQYLAETDWDEWQSEADDFEDTDDVVRKSNIENARKMKADNMAVDLIVKYTGLTAQEIEML